MTTRTPETHRTQPFLRRAALPLVALFLLGALAFGSYLSSLYQQLTEAFSKTSEFVPTRVYSDVIRIAPPMTRATIERRLKALGYTWSLATPPNREAEGSPPPPGATLRFTLHPIDYPEYLIPEGHSTSQLGGKNVYLSFASSGGAAPLSLIQSQDQTLEDFYLEPELVATLARGNQAIRSRLQFAEFPAAIWQAILAAEDQHFLEHSGLDPRGIARAILVNLKKGELAQGGSTITMQLVKNLMARRTKNLFLKFNELFLALLLEARYEKEEILERYLNEVYLGQIGSLEVHGVAEGAKHFFGKTIDQLNLGEIALMAGLIRGPGYYSPYRHKDRALERQHWVLKKMVETGQIAEAEMKAALRAPIRLVPPQTATNKAPYFVDYVNAELIRELQGKMTETEIQNAGFRVYTTLDTALYQAAQDAVATGVSELQARLKSAGDSRLEGALATVEQSTGRIRALIGGRSYAQSNFNRILNMRRQVGSTFKPIVYLTALMEGEDPQGVAYGPAYPLEDAPWTLSYDRGKQSWTPKNYEKTTPGWIPMRLALARSINTAAARLGHAVGLDSIIETAQALGIKTPLPQVPSLVLGVAELTPVELLSAYATLANHGVQNELTALRAITYDDGKLFARYVARSEASAPAGATDLLSEMMTSVFKEGTARSADKLGWSRPAAGKTGTTSNHRDAWFAGFSPRLTTVVWVGLDQVSSGSDSEKPDRALASLTGASAALPIWVRLMQRAHEGLPVEDFPASPHLVTQRIDIKSGLLAESFCPPEQVVSELYWAEHLPARSSCATDWPPSTSRAQGD